MHGDGLCGTTAHARDDIQRKYGRSVCLLSSARVVYNDSVWNRFTGSHMNMGGIMLQLALEIAQLLKGPAQSRRRSLRGQLTVLPKSAALKIPDRDGLI